MSRQFDRDTIIREVREEMISLGVKPCGAFDEDLEDLDNEELRQLWLGLFMSWDDSRRW